MSSPVDSSFDAWYAAQAHQLTNEQVCRLIWRRGWGAAAVQYADAYQREEARADAAEVRAEQAETQRDALQASRVDARGRLLPACPNCGDSDTQAAPPDWTDDGVTAEMTCPGCEHAWTAAWRLTPIVAIEPRR